ncbi:winged helix-turn-helix domain-containing protein [Photobacterium swingsii]|uniref:winged helix-turn-helix domain-containing protein n=2 Tax=Photobacterium swingsii TaxID=680026 RepID=UPI003D130589
MLVEVTSKVLINSSKSEIVHIENNGSERAIKITRPETNIIVFLNKHRGEVFSKEQLVNIGWCGRITGTNSLNVAIYNLRKYLSVDNEVSLENIPREGYKLNIINQSVFLKEETEETEETEEINDRVHYKKIQINNTSEHINSSPNKLTTIKMAILLSLNVLLITLTLIIYLNLVWVECATGENGTVCYSKSYLIIHDKGKIPDGFSVRSNHNVSNIM